MENNMEVTQKIKKEPPYDPAIPSFGFTHKNWNQDLKEIQHSPVYESTTHNNKQPKCLSTVEWIKKM